MATTEKEITRVELLRKLHPVDAWISQAIDDIHGGCAEVCAEHHEKAKKHWSQYLGDDDAPRSDGYQGYARLYPNATADTTDATVAKYLSGLFPADVDFFDVRARTARSLSKRPAVKKVLSHYFARMGFLLSIAEWLRHAVVTGTGIMQCSWLYEVAKEEIYAAEEEGAEPSFIQRGLRVLSRFIQRREPSRTKYEWAVLEDRPHLENVMLGDFFVPDIQVTDLDDVDYCGRILWLTRRQIEQDEVREVQDPDTEKPVEVGKFRNVDLVPERPGKRKSAASDEALGREDVVGGYLYGHLPMTMPIQLTEYHVCDVRALFDGCKEGWRSRLRSFWRFREEQFDGGAIFTIADEVVPIRIEPMADPRARLSTVFVLQRFKDRKDQLFGMGLPEAIRDDQIQLAAVHNQIQDWISEQLRRRTFYDDQVDLSQERLKYRKHNDFIPVRLKQGGSIHDHLWQEQIPPVPPDAFHFAFELERRIKNRTHTQDPTMGRPVSKRMTATETSEIAEGADLLFSQEIRLFESGGIVRILENVYRWTRRRMTTPLAIQIAGQYGAEIEEIEPEDIWGDFDFYLIGAREATNRFLRTQQLILLGQNPAVAQALRLPKYVARILSILGEANAEDMVFDPDSPPRMMALQKQWSTFLQGEHVEVTAQETMAEHQEAIEKHEAIFKGLILPGMANMGADERRIEAAMKAVDKNIDDHKHFLRKMAEEQQRMMEMLAAKQAGGANGSGLGALRELAVPPGTNSEVGAPGVSRPGVLPGALE